MITADRIRQLAYLGTVQVEQALQRNYPRDQVRFSRFLGITNAGQFCYEISYMDQELNGLAYTKVFVDLGLDGEPVAEY